MTPGEFQIHDVLRLYPYTHVYESTVIRTLQSKSMEGNDVIETPVLGEHVLYFPAQTYRRKETFMSVEEKVRVLSFKKLKNIGLDNR